MRIAFLSQPRDFITSSGDQVGSVAIVTWALARRLAGRHDVTILAPLAQGQAQSERSAEGIRIRRIAQVYRLTHRVLDLGTGLFGLQPPYWVCSAYFREYGNAARRLLLEQPPDIVHVQSSSQFLPDLREALPRSAIVLHVHDELLACIDHPLPAARLAAADAIATCSDYISQRWRERFPQYASAVRTIGNGVDLTMFHPGAPPEHRAHEVLFVGRVSPEKGVHLLMRAFELVLKQVPDATLTLAGPAGLLPFSHLWLLAYDEQIAALREFYGVGLMDKLRKQILRGRRGYLHDALVGVSDETRARIRVMHHVPFESLPHLYRHAGVLVAPSIMREPFGLPVVEALASGLPVVAHRTGALPSLVDEGITGHLVERGDVPGLAQAICRVLTDTKTARAMGVAARTAAENRFDWAGSVDRLEQVYAELRDEKPVPSAALATGAR